MSPDTQQNLIYTIYFIFLHNFAALVYFVGMIIGIVLAFWKPSRSYIMIMLGFMLLLFSFEYSKHIVDGLREQTTNSLVTVRQSARITRVVYLVIARAIPLGLPLLGWLLVLGGVGMRFFYHRKKEAR